jgi:hypothetical protein
MHNPRELTGGLEQIGLELIHEGKAHRTSEAGRDEVVRDVCAKTSWV